MLTKAIPILLSISFVPGLCMLLALNLGLRFGVRRTIWMMIGELCAVSLIALLVMLGISAIIIGNPLAYRAMTFFGCIYLVYVGICVMLSGKPHADQHMSGAAHSPAALFRLGFIVAASNPKPWILYTSLLPALLLPDRPLMPQALQLIVLLVVIELASLLLYASGGHGLRLLLVKKQIGRVVNLVLGSTIVTTGVALLVST